VFRSTSEAAVTAGQQPRRLDAIQILHLTKRYGSTLALDALDLEVAQR
jgi:hypothetical protein